MLTQTRRQIGALEYPQLSHTWNMAHCSKQLPEYIVITQE